MRQNLHRCRRLKVWSDKSRKFDNAEYCMFSAGARWPMKSIPRSDLANTFDFFGHCWRWRCTFVRWQLVTVVAITAPTLSGALLALTLHIRQMTAGHRGRYHSPYTYAGRSKVSKRLSIRVDELKSRNELRANGWIEMTHFLGTNGCTLTYEVRVSISAKSLMFFWPSISRSNFDIS